MEKAQVKITPNKCFSMAKVFASVLNADLSKWKQWLPELEKAKIDGIQFPTETFEDFKGFQYLIPFYEKLLQLESGLQRA